MCCTTFLHEGQLNTPTHNEDLNQILHDVRVETGEDWQVVEYRIFYKRRWYTLKRSVRYEYELYKYVGGVGPWQLINFYKDDAESSMNFTNKAELVIAFLLGILSGIHSERFKNVKNNS